MSQVRLGCSPLSSGPGLYKTRERRSDTSQLKTVDTGLVVWPLVRGQSTFRPVQHDSLHLHSGNTRPLKPDIAQQIIREQQILVQEQTTQIEDLQEANMDLHTKLIAQEARLRKQTQQVRTQTDQIAALTVQQQHAKSFAQLTGALAHDFNNMLNAVTGYTELALDDLPKDSSLDRKLQRVLTAGRSAAELVQQLLLHTRSLRQAPEALKPVNLSIALTDFNTLWGPLHKQMDLEVLVEPTIHALNVMAHPGQLTQILQNMVNNAHQAGAKQVHISLQRNASDGTVSLLVQDNGNGMPPEVLQQVGTTVFTHGKENGNGYGVYTARKAIEDWGGTFHIRSHVAEDASDTQHGTTFTMTLPLLGPLLK